MNLVLVLGVMLGVLGVIAYANADDQHEVVAGGVLIGVGATLLAFALLHNIGVYVVVPSK